MMWPFYLMALVAIVSTIRVVTNANPVHALLSLIVSLLAVAGMFMIVGAPFAGALEIIVYAGAIMVLFVFVIMMLNLNQDTMARERAWLASSIWLGPGALAVVLLAVLAIAMSSGASMGSIDGSPLMAERVGKAMFGVYVLVVELAAFVLLAALVVASHLGRDERDASERNRGAAAHGRRHPGGEQ